jgi:hypothetical protein
LKALVVIQTYSVSNQARGFAMANEKWKIMENDKWEISVLNGCIRTTKINQRAN